MERLSANKPETLGVSAQPIARDPMIPSEMQIRFQRVQIEAVLFSGFDETRDCLNHGSVHFRRDRIVF